MPDDAELPTRAPSAAVRRPRASRPRYLSAVPDAVLGHRMHLEFQPEIDLRTGAVLAVEALLRWDDSALSGRSLESTLLAAQSRGLMPAIGEWVLQSACVQLLQWRESLGDNSFTVRVNVAPSQVTERFLELVHIQLATGVPPDVLCFELTELGPAGDPQLIGRVLREIRQLGIAVALDDVGTGVNSLVRVRDTPVDALKIDRGFVSEADRDPRSRAVVEMILLLGERLGAEVVAEGVERAETARTLLELGCTRAQGFLFGMAAPAVELTDVLRAGSVDLSALALIHR